MKCGLVWREIQFLVNKSTFQCVMQSSSVCSEVQFLGQYMTVKYNSVSSPVQCAVQYKTLGHGGRASEGSAWHSPACSLSPSTGGAVRWSLPFHSYLFPSSPFSSLPLTSTPFYPLALPCLAFSSLLFSSLLFSSLLFPFLPFYSLVCSSISFTFLPFI